MYMFVTECSVLAPHEVHSCYQQNEQYSPSTMRGEQSDETRQQPHAGVHTQPWTQLCTAYAQTMHW